MNLSVRCNGSKRGTVIPHPSRLSEHINLDPGQLKRNAKSAANAHEHVQHRRGVYPMWVWHPCLWPEIVYVTTAHMDTNPNRPSFGGQRRPGYLLSSIIKGVTLRTN